MLSPTASSKQSKVDATPYEIHEKSWGDRSDIYVQFMKQKEPNFSALGPLDEKVETVEDSTCRKAISDDLPTRFACKTQEVGTEQAIYMGVRPNTMYLWQNNSTINWVARADGYPDNKPGAGLAVETQRAMYAATGAWQNALQNRVRFQYVTNFSTAAFQVKYAGDGGNFAAEAFFPDTYQLVLNEVKVFLAALKTEALPYLARVLTHEVGHIIGLRHEHSQEPDGQGNGPEDEAGGLESILFGSRNPKSVMGYPPLSQYTIQPSDETYTKNAYDQLTNGKIISGTGRFGIITKTVIRVPPEN